MGKKPSDWKEVSLDTNNWVNRPFYTLTLEPFPASVYRCLKAGYATPYREKPPVVLYEQQGHADDRRAVFDPHRVDVRTPVASFTLQQVGPKDHRKVGSSHLVTGNLDGERGIT